ncbi:MAG: YdcF family protein [Leptolyngbya sp. SIO1D8]|nr:YdcF family protein [Leptolyngbya sp. SIO1D8]
MPEPTNLWTTFTWALFDWVSSPRIFVPFCLSVIFLALVAKRPTWLRSLSKVAACLLVSYCLLATPLTASILVKGLTFSLPENDPPQSADAIVVLSRDDELGYSRYDLAIQLWQEDRSPKIFVTALGRVGYMTARFKGEGWPVSALDGTTCARTTYEEAISAAAILQPKGVERIFLITDSPHLFRAASIFRALGFTVFPQAASLPTELPTLKKSLLALREYLGFINYTILGRFREHTLEESRQLTQATIDSSDCLVDWLRKA